MSRGSKSPDASRPQTNHLAITSLALGLVSIVLCLLGLFLLAIAIETWERSSRHWIAWIFPLMVPVSGLICGVISLRRVKNSSGREGGRRLALTGVILNAAALVAFPVALPKVRATAMRAHCVANRTRMRPDLVSS